MPDGELEHQVTVKLAKRLQEIGETLAEDLNPDCVYVVEQRSTDSSTRRTFVARWMPKPGSPIELLGGGSDGEVMQLRVDEEGMPEPRTLRMGPTGPIDGNLFDHIDDYELIGFRNDSARWIYEAR